MDDAFFDYIPPKQEKRKPFSLRLDAVEHARLILWAQTEGAKHGARERAKAARHGLNKFLDDQGIPRAEDLVRQQLNDLRYGQRKAG